MKILVIGSGGREHALAWKLAQEAEVICAPGNAGISEQIQCFPVAVDDTEGLIFLAQNEMVDLVVVGPEDPLINGLADAMVGAGIPVFGPKKFPAQLEGSKEFSKRMMMKAGVPTAEFESFTDVEEAKKYAASLSGKVAVKASGNALGKGVIVCDNVEESDDAIMKIRTIGTAADTIVIEEKLIGPEFSLLTLVSGTRIFSLPVAQDYKRAFDSDMGPNTGGMGTFSPVEMVTDEVVRETEDRIVRPMLEELKNQYAEYRGVLFSGLMMTPDGIKCLEYNVRFGDPETQTVMRRIGNGLADALYACAMGTEIPPVEVLDNAAVTVVLASGGYPGPYQTGAPIAMGDAPEGVITFHAGTRWENDVLVSSGGRVLGVSGVGENVAEARKVAYAGLDTIDFENMHFRTDIGVGH